MDLLEIEMLEHLFSEHEVAFRISAYVNAKTEITSVMRSIVHPGALTCGGQDKFKLNHETLYTPVKMTDTYLSTKQVSCYQYFEGKF